MESFPMVFPHTITVPDPILHIIMKILSILPALLLQIMVLKIILPFT